MNTATTAPGFAPTVPLLGANGWIVPPAAAEQPGRLVALLREWLHRSRTRSTIRELDDRMLRDIGLTRGDALVEADKPFWLA
jgi:uncharacterized protein YjiS (DUF1127 family)